MKKIIFAFALIAINVACVWALETQGNDSIYSFTTQRAFYHGGEAAMMKQLAEHLVLPGGLAKDFSGRTTIKAVVEKNGDLSHFAIAKSCGRADVDSAVMKAATHLSGYVPAKNNDEVVRSYTFIPASFPTMFKLLSVKNMPQPTFSVKVVVEESSAPASAVVPSSQNVLDSNKKYYKLLPPKYLIGALEDTVSVFLKYAPAGTDATHYEKTITRGDTTIIQRVNVTTKKVSDEDVRVRGTFRRQNIYDNSGHLKMRTSPYKGGLYIKTKHYRAGKVVREYVIGRDDVIQATFYDEKGNVKGLYLYENGNVRKISSPVLGVDPTSASTSVPASAPSSNATKVEETGPIFQVVEQMPQFPGGEMALFKFLNDNVKYPVIAKENGIQGTAIVSFVVNTDGSIVDVEIEKASGDASLDKEARRVIKCMPNWIPGRNEGKVVRVKYTVPVNFRLQ